MRSQTEGTSYFRPKDIYNDRQMIRKSSLEGLTPTQQWVNLLQQQGLRHFIRYDEDHKITAVFWTYPWCEEQWKRFPEVLGLDNTYKTNRFKMYLFQVTGITDQKSVANFGFGLINTEKKEGYDWLCDRLDDLRQQLGIPAPSVVITDKEKALKNALERVFPKAQQQLCLYHINANVHAKITSRWKKDDSDEAPDPDADELAGPEATEATEPIAEPATEPAADPDEKEPEYSKEDLKKHWNRVVYAEEEDDFEAAWAQILIAYGNRQKAIIDYLVSEYLPVADQFLQCRIKRYRNFGQRTNSPTETAHKDIKSYLVTGTGDLLHLHEALVQMLAKKERDYLQTAAKHQVKLRQEYIGRAWLGSLPTQISYAAVDLLAKEHRRAEGAVKGNATLPPCEGSCYITQQFALPCAHYIAEKVILEGQPLTKDLIHPRWWLDKPLVFLPAVFYVKATNPAS